MQWKIKKTRLWIPALGFVIAYGYLHNCAIYPHVECEIVGWSELTLAFSVLIGLGGARDILLKKFEYLGDISSPKSEQDSFIKKLTNRLWIPIIGWCLVLGFANNIILVPYLPDTVKTVDWTWMITTLAILLTISGARDYSLYSHESSQKAKQA
jgi:hypothetical protein